MNESPTSERAQHRRLLGSIRASLSVARVCEDADRFGGVAKRRARPDSDGCTNGPSWYPVRASARSGRRTEALRVFVSSWQIWCAATCVLALLGPAIPAHADVSTFLDKPIASVRLVVEGRDTTDSTLTQLIETQSGQPLTMAQVRETVSHLFSLGRFEDVRVDATLENGRVALRYELSPIHPVTAIRFAGAVGPGIDRSALRQVIVDRYGGSPPAGRAADMKRLLEDALGERGYLHPSVTINVETEHSPERATLVFTVQPGDRTRVGAVEVVGRPPVTPAELLRRLRIVSGAPYLREDIRHRIDRYVDERRNRGYYETRVVPTVTLADGDRIANLTIAVTPGPHVRVVFTGDPLPSDARAELVPVAREGSVDEDLLEDSSHRMQEFLRAQGYRAATAVYSRETTGGELVITFTVKKGRQYRVASIDMAGNAAMSRAELDAALRMREGQLFSDVRLDADAAAIADLYHRRGFATAKAQTGVDPLPSAAMSTEVPVAVHIVIAEGARTLVDRVVLEGNGSVDDAVLESALVLQPGRPYVPEQVAIDRDAIQLAYVNRGYQNATVEPRPEFSDDRSRIALRYSIHEGPRVFVGHVLIVGNVRTATSTIERELQVKPGDPYSLAAINESQRRLAALGLFRRARITELRHGDETTRDVLITVEEAPPTTIGFGGGLEGRLRPVRSEELGGAVREQFEVAPRAFFEVGRRNLFGKNRSVNFFSSLSLHPKDSPFFADETAVTSGGYGLTEYRVLGTYREPRLLDTAFDGFATLTFEQQIRSSFNFARRSVSAEAARKLTRNLAVSGSYQIQRTRLFDVAVSDADRLTIDKVFSQFRLSSFSASLIRDSRSDTVEPVAGGYVSVSGQLAARQIGSEVGFGKSFLTAQIFRTVRGTNRLVLAGNARLGMATGFTSDEQLPASERFFAGGDTTIRGFALDRVGIPGKTLDQDGVPIGGNGLVIFNAELRAPVSGRLGVVGFVDAGNVFVRASDLDLGALRSATGGGIRYKSPFGPVRFDLGFKVNRRPGEQLTAWYVSFGQAF
jgi:outer membrane protein insertion porin family